MRIALQKPGAAVESETSDSAAALLFGAPNEEAGTERGILWVVSVPIGDLDDITIRALRVLRDADLIIAEDLRITRNLLRWHGVTAPDMISLRPRRSQAAREAMQSALRGGCHVALMCDAGTPGVAEPGQEFMRVALDCGAAISAAPGPCAALAALAVSSFSAQDFAFRGFPPRAPVSRPAFFHKLARETGTILLYEKPSGLSATLTELCHACGASRPAVLACDLTKPSQQIRRGTLAELRACCETHPPGGEMVLILDGLPKKQ